MHRSDTANQDRASRIRQWWHRRGRPTRAERLRGAFLRVLSEIPPTDLEIFLKLKPIVLSLGRHDVAGIFQPLHHSSRRPHAKPQAPIIVVNLALLSREPDALQYTVALQVARLIAPRRTEADLPHGAGASSPEPPDGEERVDPVSSLMRRWGFREPASVRRADGRVEVVALTSDGPDVLLSGWQPHGDEDLWASCEDSDGRRAGCAS